MNETFNKQILFDNIADIVRERGIKIGELEAAVKVSPGYISRASKEGGSTPGIEFIVNVARELKISIDTLISVRLTALTPTEKYLVEFIDKLRKDTSDGKLDWDRETQESLLNVETDQNGFAEHPLFDFRKFTEENEYEEMEEIRDTRFVSHTFDVHTVVSGDCFNLRLKNGTRLYLMKISRCGIHIAGEVNEAIEMWMVDSNGKASFICNDNEIFMLILQLDSLYTEVTESFKHPKIKKELKYVIDAYMKDDLSDDPKDPFSDLPF